MLKEAILFSILAMLTYSSLIEIENQKVIFQHPFASRKKMKQEEKEQCYGAIADAGSTGTRVYVFHWPCRKKPEIPVFQNVEGSPSKKVAPGIHTFEKNLAGLALYLKPLIDFAAQNVPKNKLSSTPFYFGATAGMRSLSIQSQRQIIKIVKGLLKKSGFLFNDTWAGVITGAEEGISGWLAVNYLLGVFENVNDTQNTQNTSAAIDIGGASTQITFTPDVNFTQYKYDIELSNNQSYTVYSYSHFDYGLDFARFATYKGCDILKENVWFNNIIYKKVIYYPCYQKGYKEPFENDKAILIIGTGSQIECSKLIIQHLKIDKQKTANHSLNNVFQPKLSSDQTYYGFSGLFYTANFYGLAKQEINPFKLLEKVTAFCNLTWEEVNQARTVDSYTKVYCLQGIYIYHLLTYGYNFEMAKSFIAVDKIQNTTVSWVLGMMLRQIDLLPFCIDTPSACETTVDSSYFPFRRIIKRITKKSRKLK